MDLKVWTDDGVARIVSGLDRNTTCKDVMIVMARVTGGVGRYCMTLCWKGGHRKLNPAEKPHEVLKSLDGFYEDVRFYVHSSAKETHRKQKSMPSNFDVDSQFQVNTKESVRNNMMTYNYVPGDMNLRSEAKGRRTLETIAQQSPTSTSNSNENQSIGLKDFNNSSDSNGTLINKLSNVMSSSSAFDLYNGGHQKKLSSFTTDPIASNPAAHHIQHQNTEFLLLKKKYADLQDEMFHLKSESEREKSAATAEEENIKQLMEEVERAQLNLDRLNDELEDLQLVSWEDKLRMERREEERLKDQTGRAEGRLEGLRVDILSLDEKISAVKEEVSNEEDLKRSQESELEGLKQNLSEWQKNSEQLEEQLQKLDGEISMLQGSLDRNEEHLALGRERMVVLANDGMP